MSVQGSPESGGPSDALKSKRSRREARAAPGSRPWLRILPFFLSAMLFLSGVFSLFAPVPLLLAGIHQGAWVALGAGVVNSSVIYLLGGGGAQGAWLALFFFLAVVEVGVLMPWFLRDKRKTLESTLGWTWAAQLGTVVLAVIAFALYRGESPIQTLSTSLNSFFDWLIGSVNPESRRQLFGEMDPQDWKAQSMIELPMSLITVGLVFIWVNLILLLSFMGRVRRAELGLDRKSFFRWKTADWVIWPVIAVWAALLLLKGPSEDLALGAFKALMVLYGIQGVAVMGSVLDAWKIRGFFRMLVYFFAFFAVPPLVVAIGFFDQWFDFRSKIRQS